MNGLQRTISCEKQLSNQTELPFWLCSANIDVCLPAAKMSRTNRADTLLPSFVAISGTSCPSTSGIIGNTSCRTAWLGIDMRGG